MKENELIKYGYPTQYSNEIAYTVQPKKRASPVLKILLGLIVIAITVLLFNKYKSPIFNFFGIGIITDESSALTESDGTSSNEESTDISTENNTESQLPNASAFPIYAINGKGNGITNETSKDYNISKEGFKLITPTNIYAQYGSSAPVVLIIHSMANESYSNGKYYCESDSFYKETENVASIGEVIVKVLDEYNINAIHVSKIFSSSANSSSAEYEKELIKILAEYPSIKYVIDISRDVEINKDMSMPKHIFESTLGGCAKIRLVTGSDFLQKNEYVNDNISFMASLQSSIEDRNPELIRSGSISPFPLSGNLAKNSIRVYIGSFANSYSEANNAAILFAECLAKFLNNASI